MGLEPRLAPIVACVFLLAPPAAAPPSAPLYVSPGKAEPGAGFSGEAGARDFDSLGTSTWATRALSRTCTIQGGCAGVSSSTTIWSGFPVGYRPRSIAVHWKAAASGGLFGGMSQVRAFVEYSRARDDWTLLGRFVSNEGFDTMPATVSQAAVAADTDPASVRVRARLEVEMVSCPNDSCPADLPNPSNVSGQMWLSDIRLEVEEPVLLARPARLRTGGPVQVLVQGAPGAQIGGWTFRTAKGTEAARTDDLTAATWTFAASESGTVHATVRLRGQPQVDGRTYELSTPIDVRRSR